MARSDRHIHRRVLTAGLFATLLVLLAYSAGLFERLEGGLYDLRAQKFQHFMPPPTDKVVHLDIDDAALEAIGAWPWPRTLMGELVDEMSAAGPKVIALDILYSEPQEKEWKPVDRTDAPQQRNEAATRPVSGRFELVDHDANLAAAFRRAGNVLVPASLLFESSHTQSRGIERATDLLTENLELSPQLLAQKLAAEGFGPRDLADVDSIFFTIRREATCRRIERELDRGIAPATIPATPAAAWGTGLPSAASAATQSRLDSIPQRARIQVALRAKLFPSRDPTLNSPEARLVDAAYDQVAASRAFLRLGYPPTPNVPAFVAREEILPLPRLIDAAASTGYVDYPNFGDGTARRIALMMDYRGKRFLQISLRVACQMLEIDPGELIVTPTSIVIPAGTLADGTPRQELRIPVRTTHHSGGHGEMAEVPLEMNIPFSGPREWWAMYDPQHPDLKKQHVSLGRVYDAVRTQQKLTEDAARVDDAAIFLLAQQRIASGVQTLGMDVARAKAYFANRPLPQDVDARLKLINDLFGVVETNDLERSFRKLDPQKMSEDERGQARELPIHMANLRAAQAELPKLAAQLAQQRQELRTLLHGKAVLIGWTAVALIADAKPTPIHAAAPGVIIHGAILNGILTGELWNRVPTWIAILLSAVLGIIVTASVARFSPVRALLVTVGLVVCYTIVNCVVLFDYGNKILELGTPLLAMVVAWAGATIVRLVIEARERTRITRRFATYVDPDIVNYFLEVRDETMFSGQRRDTTVVFTDLEGFTKLSNQLGEEIVPLLNDFMGRAVAVIKQHRGLVNKFLGDGILFFFNAPKPNATYIPDAVDAILDLQVMMAGFNEDLAKQKLPSLKLRAGVTTGRVIAGDAGTKDRADYTVIGDLVNLASRLESANKYFGTSNLVTETTVKGAGEGFLFRPVGVIRVLGMETGVMAYETLAWRKDATDRQKQIAAISAKLCAAFSTGEAQACLTAIDELEAIEGPTKLTNAYREICTPHASGAQQGAMPKEIVLAEK